MAKTPAIEQCFEQIEAAIEDLENGELPLAKALERYEAALKQVRVARQQLDGFQARLVELRADGSEVEQDPDASE